MDDRLTRIEEALADALRAVDELSSQVAEQRSEIDILTRRVAMLMQREAVREQAESGGEYFADERPPHW